MRTPSPPPHHFRYDSDWRHAPMAYWVHVPQHDTVGQESLTYLPPAPLAHGRKGFPVLCVEFGPEVLVFSSVPQLDEAIRVLALKPLPTTRRLSRERDALESAPQALPARRKARRAGTSLPLGPNSHWLSRLPTALKATKARERVVAGLRAVRAVVVRDGAFVAPP